MNSRFFAYIAALSAAIIWGVNGTMVQYLVVTKAMDIEWLITLRLLIPGIILLLISCFSSKRKQIIDVWKNKKDALALMVFSIAMIAVQYTFFATIKASNAATATIIQYLAPVLIALYYAIVNLKRPSQKETIALILALTGTFLLATGGNINTIAISGTAIFWGLLSAAGLAFYAIQPVRLLKEYSANIVIGWAMLMGGILFSFVHAPWDVSGTWDLTTLSLFAFIVLIGGLLAFSFYLRSVKIIGGYITTLLTSVEPLTATIIAIVWLKVAFGIPELIGGVCVISTVFLLSKKGGD
ncbi:DMT family transporter [Flavobacterium cerinum]|uniref:EamA family transporter n=1 Tax=Flavobacterium cerinum TaxID=2502784 RepID=A0A3S3QEC5_9FLAO|nr:EamA family transporter [Flavobacterium cerinum]RWX02416.1 EamA family transporter [Flavobacterium cerinum]